MITEWQMYWLLKMSDIRILLGLSAGAMVIMTIVFFFMARDGDLKVEDEKMARTSKRLVPIFILFILVSSLMPSTKQLAVIVVTPKIVNTIAENEDMKELPDAVMKLANDWVKELSPEN